MGWTAEQPPGGAEHARRSSSFGQQAGGYAAYRPGYPDAAVRWALEPVVDPTADDLSGLRVLDLAAGTGKLTEALVRLGADVVAVEPDVEMVAELRRRVPVVQVFSGRAEDIPATDASFDAVLVGQAFHWFDTERAVLEIARVVRAGGVLALLWNFDDAR
ncbi:MAG TPA: class I SAM-dependent methyltransferase, partial [Actinopolymorphaceae bacterium]|nr:class I SAM-dependent methyltransferase [Actinopolymorphaceae bacterium]